MGKTEFLVRVDLPEGCGKSYFREYMREAIENWSGQFELGHPLLGWFCDYERKLTIRFIKGD